MPALLLVLVLAALPWPGAWGLLKTVLPLVVVVMAARRRPQPLAALGLTPPARPVVMLAGGIALGVVLYALDLVTVRPLGRLLFDQPTEVGALGSIRGSLPNLLVALVFMWLFAAIGEEIVWRGFVLDRLGRRFGGSHPAWAVAVLVSSALFAALHAYQGPRGVLHAGIGAVVLAALYLAGGRRHLWLPILVHGTKNTVSFLLIYLDRYDAVVNRL